MPAQSSPGKEVDITTLEMAFAKDPASDAFISLSEAYLKQGRFMEAMVVCKKGIKSKPESQEGRLLLARIYAEQGKTPKAMDEITKILENDADFVPALLLRGGLQLKQGQDDDAIATYKAALEVDPENEEAIEALKEKGVEYTPPSAQPEPEPEPEPEPTQPQAAPAQAAAPTGAVSQPPAVAQAPTYPPAAGSQPPAQVTSPPGFPATHSAPPMAVPSQGSQAASYDGRNFDPNQGLKQVAKKGAGVTLGILATGIAILGIFLIWFAVHASNLRKIDKLNTAALELVSKDSYAELGKAVEKLDEVIKMDDEQELAVGLKAFALAVRVLEHGGREDQDTYTEALKNAKEYSDTSWRWAAEIMDMTGGDPEGAVKLAEEKIKAGYGTVQTFVALGAAALAAGELDIAQNALKNAREKGPTAVRAQAASGEFYRRMLQIQLARAQYDASLKTSPNHALALAGRSMLALEDPSLSSLYNANRDWESIRDIGRANVGPRVWGRAKTIDAFISTIRGKNDDAEGALKEAEEKAREDADVHYMTGRVYLMMKKRDLAIEKLKKSASIDKNRVATQVLLARALTEAGKGEEADRHLAIARKLDSSNVQIVVAEALSKRRAGKFDEAIRLLEKAEAGAPGTASVSLELLETYRKAKYFDKVKTKFQKLTETFGETKSVMTKALVTMGRAFLAQNQIGPAVESFKTAIEFDKKNADAYYFRCFALRGDRKLRTEAYASCQKYLELAAGGTYADQAKKLADTLR